MSQKICGHIPQCQLSGADTLKVHPVETGLLCNKVTYPENKLFKKFVLVIHIVRRVTGAFSHLLLGLPHV